MIEVMNPQVKNSVVTVAKEAPCASAREPFKGLRSRKDIACNDQRPKRPGEGAETRQDNVLLDVLTQFFRRHVVIQAALQLAAKPAEQVPLALNDPAANQDPAWSGGQDQCVQQLPECVDHQSPDRFSSAQCSSGHSSTLLDRRTGRQALQAIAVERAYA